MRPARPGGCSGWVGMRGGGGLARSRPASRRPEANRPAAPSLMLWPLPRHVTEHTKPIPGAERSQFSANCSNPWDLERLIRASARTERTRAPRRANPSVQVLCGPVRLRTARAPDLGRRPPPSEPDDLAPTEPERVQVPFATVRDRAGCLASGGPVSGLPRNIRYHRESAPRSSPFLWRPAARQKVPPSEVRAWSARARRASAARWWNLAISKLRLDGVASIAAAIRRNAARVKDRCAS